MGGGFIEFLFNNTGEAPRARRAVADPYVRDPNANRGYEPEPVLASRGSIYGHQGAEPARPAMDPRYLPQAVSYDGSHAPGTIVDRYAEQVPLSGAGRRQGDPLRHRRRPSRLHLGRREDVTRKAEWPDWVPPAEMLQRRPDLPRHMAGGPDNPLGARAMYLGSSLYRIHGSNEPWTIGTRSRRAASACATRT